MVASLFLQNIGSGTQASVIAAHGPEWLQFQPLEHRLNSCQAQAQLFHSMWNISRPGIKSMSPALADRSLYP